MKLLRAAYPGAAVSPDAVELWIAELRRLDDGIGEQAVRSLIGSVKFFPSLAELNEQVEIARAQRARRRRDEERRRDDETAEAMPMPPLHEIPGVVEFLDRIGG